MIQRLPGAGWLAAAGLVLPLACVFPQHRDLTRARDAHDACVEAYGEGHGACEASEERLRVEEQRYREASRRAWGCNPEDDSACPPP